MDWRNHIRSDQRILSGEPAVRGTLLSVEFLLGLRLSNLVGIFANPNLSANRAEDDDLLGDAYECLMRHFATESEKSKGQFYTPAEVSRVMARVLDIGPSAGQERAVYDSICGHGSLLPKVADEGPKTPQGDS